MLFYFLFPSNCEHESSHLLFCSDYWKEWWMDIVKYNNYYIALQNWEWTSLRKNWKVGCQLLLYLVLKLIHRIGLYEIMKVILSPLDIEKNALRHFWYRILQSMSYNTLWMAMQYVCKVDKGDITRSNYNL